MLPIILVKIFERNQQLIESILYYTTVKDCFKHFMLINCLIERGYFSFSQCDLKNYQKSIYIFLFNCIFVVIIFFQLEFLYIEKILTSLSIIDRWKIDKRIQMFQNLYDTIHSRTLVRDANDYISSKHYQKFTQKIDQNTFDIILLNLYFQIRKTNLYQELKIKYI